MKKLVSLVILILITGISAKSQSYRFSGGIGGGMTQSYADVKNSFNPQRIVHLNANYFVSTFISIGAEFQLGKLINGIAPVEGVNYPYFESDFHGYNINTRVSLGQFVKSKDNEFLRKIQGLYAGVGIGAITTSQKNNTESANSRKGSNNDRMVSIPVNLGIDFYLHKKFYPLAIGINTEVNMIPNDHLDGFDTNSNKWIDMYAFTSVSVKYNFGSSNMLNRNIFPQRRRLILKSPHRS